MRTTALLAIALAGCIDASSSDPARDAWLQIPGLQWRPGPLPDDEGGPIVEAVQILRPTIILGTVDERYIGAMAPGTTAFAIAVDGDIGGWLGAAGLPLNDTPLSPSFDFRAGYSRDMPLGPFALEAVALDAEGRAGPRFRIDHVAEPADVPEGELVVGLAWTGAADLDIHVVDPMGGEAWSGDPNTWERPPPPMPVPPDAWREGGILTHDGNAACNRDAIPTEHVVWEMPPPSGEYIVRVDTPSLCGAPIAAWSVTVYRFGVLIGAATGTSVPDDVLLPHGAGNGVEALRFVLE
jgi:hypothetical protein